MRINKLLVLGVTIAVLVVVAYVLGRPKGLSIEQAGTATKAQAEITVRSRMLSDQINEISFAPATDAIVVLTKNQDSKHQRISRFSCNDIDSVQLLRETREVMQGLVVASDGNVVYTGQWGTGPNQELEILQLDVETGRILKKFQGEVNGFGIQVTSDPTAIGLSPDGATLVVGTKLVDAELIAGGHIGGEVYAWNTKSGEMLWRNSTVHTNIIRSIAFSPDGLSMASAGEDALIRIWDVASGDLRKTLVGVLWGGVSSMQFSPDGKYLVTGGAGLEEGGRVRIWDLSKAKIAHLFSPFKNQSYVHIAFDATGRLFGSSQSTESSNESPAFEVRMWDARTFTELGVVGRGTGFVRALKAAQHKSAITVGTSNGELIVYDLGRSTTP